MLIGLQEALDFGEQHNCGIAAVNTPTFEMLVATIRVAERHGVPMVLQHAGVVGLRIEQRRGQAQQEAAGQ